MVASCLLGGAAGWALTAAGAGAATLAPAYDAGLTTIGLMTTALALTYATLQLPAGVLVDRIGGRRAALMGMSVVVVVHVIAALEPWTPLALACRAAAGAGYAICFVCGTELLRRSGIGAAGLGIFGGVSLAASGAAVAIVPMAEPLLGWRCAWVTSGVVALVALGVATRLPRDLPASPVAPRTRPASAPIRLSADGELYRLAAVHAVTLGLGVVLSNWTAVVLMEAWGFGAEMAAGAASLILGMTILSRPLGGHLARTRPQSTATVTTWSLLACATATLALAFPTATPVAYVAAGVLGLAGGLPFAAVIAAGQARRPDRPAAAVGLLNGLANGVIVVGTPSAAAAIDHAHAREALLVCTVVWLVPLLASPRSFRRDPSPGSSSAGHHAR